MPIDVQDRGSKHRCFQCQTLFYDLKRPKLVCPRCGVDQADEAKLKPATTKKSRAKPAPAPVAKVEEPAEVEEAEDAPEVEEEDDDEDDEPEDVDD